MVDEVAKAICDAAGRGPSGELPECRMCKGCQEGREGRECIFWETFRDEARAAIIAAYRWHKRERRWPSFVSK